jgi:DMSO/TMAO reductase YedYZ molybdopterin-dependent catalytic subunit
MNRRQLLKQLLTGSGGLIAAALVPSCGDRQDISQLFPLDLISPEVPLPEHLLTPLSEFYVQSYALPPKVDPERWRLQINGAVSRPLTLTLNDILAAPQEEFHLTMECIGNPAGGNLIGNARWQGTPLLPFLEQAGIKPETLQFRLHGADWYETTLPIEAVMRSGVMLVHRMNGEPLSQKHGYPLRIIIPGYFGQKQPKWLVRIEAATTVKQGFWERQGWSNTAQIPLHALMRQVQNQRVWHRQSAASLPPTGQLGWKEGILLAGVALDHQQPITAIEVSTDGGKTWAIAEQNRPASPHEWTLWRYRWQPQRSGKYLILARAKTQTQQQPPEDKNSRDGDSGVLKIQVTLK